MSRPVCHIIPATFLSLSLVFSGCKTIYSDTYSPRRNHFIAVKEKPKKTEPIPALTEPEPAPPGGLGLPPIAPPPVTPMEPVMPADGAAPPIPGL